MIDSRMKLELDFHFQSAVGICSMGVMHPELIMKSVIPVIMAGIIGIYGLVVAMVLKGKVGDCFFTRFFL